MLTEAQWTVYEQWVDGEYMTQVDDAREEAVLRGVMLAMAILAQTDEHNPAFAPLQEQAYSYLNRFGNIKELPLRRHQERKLLVMNYGEEEVQAMEEQENEEKSDERTS